MLAYGIWLRDLHFGERNATRSAVFIGILLYPVFDHSSSSNLSFVQMCDLFVHHAVVPNTVRFGVSTRYGMTIAARTAVLSNVISNCSRLLTRSRTMLLFVSLLNAVYFATASPSINLPVNAQVPPVAIVDQAYKFTFSTSTFTSTASPINYTLGNCPSWLQLNDSTRTFYGTPRSNGIEPGEVESFVVDLVATDETGPTTIPVTVVVTEDPGPQLGIPVAAQLPAFGAFSNPDTLLLAPGAILSLTFSPTTFINTNEHTMYNAICANNTPLPSWIIFDPRSLTFSGTTPQVTSPSELPQNLSIQITASEIAGFSQAVATFELVIESHVFAFDNTLHILNATIGSPVNFSSLHSELTLDGQPVLESDLVKVDTNKPSWLSLSNSTLALSGTAPTIPLQQNFTITATDRYGDSASTVVLVRIVGNASTTLINPITALSATIGTDFTFTLNNSLPLMKDVNATVDSGTASAWLEFDPYSLTLYGHVPSNLEPQTVQFSVIVTQGSQSQSQIVDINVICKNNACPVIGGDSGASGAPVNSKRRSSKSWVAAAIILPLFILAGLLILCCCYRRNGWKLGLDLKPRKTRIVISRPFSGEEEGLKEAQAAYHWDRGREREHLSSSLSSLSLETAASPKITRAQDSGIGHNSRFRLSKTIGGDQDRSPRPDSWQSYIRRLEPSRWKHPEAAPEFRLVHEREKLHPERTTTSSEQIFPPTNLLPSTTANVPSSKRLSRHRKDISNVSYGGFGSLHGRPASGLGHGRNGPSQASSSVFFLNRGVGHGDGSTPHGPPGWGIVRNSWRNLSRLSWTSTQSSPNSNDPIVEEGLERSLTQKSFASILSSFPRPSTSNTADILARHQVIHETSDDETSESDIPKPLPTSPPKARTGSPFRRKSSKRNDGLQDFHKRRLQQKSHNPLFSAHLSASHKSSLHLARNQRKATIQVDPTTQPDQILPRSYSQSSSLTPQSLKSSKSISSPNGRKSRIHYNFTTRALSPLRRSRSSYASTTTGSSKFSDPISSIAPFYPHGALLEEDTDNEGNKQWRHLHHPNPLGAHRTDAERDFTDVSDAELIESLRAAGQFNAADRLNYLRAQTEGLDDAKESELETAVEVRSARGRKLDDKSGLKSGDSGNKSLRGDIDDVGGSSAFM